MNLTGTFYVTKNTEGLKYTKNATPVLSGSLAWYGYKQEKPYYIDFQAWKGVAEALDRYMQHCRKNDKKMGISILQSDIKMDSWEDKSGNRKTKLVLNIKEFTAKGHIPKADNPDAGFVDNSAPEYDEPPF